MAKGNSEVFLSHKVKYVSVVLVQYQWGTSGLLIFACSWLPPVPGTKTTTTINNAPCESNIYLLTHLLIQFIVMNILGVFSRHLLQVTTPKINYFDFLQSLKNDHFYHASKPSHFSNNRRFIDPFFKKDNSNVALDSFSLCFWRLASK